MKNSEIIMLKLMEGLCKQGIVPVEVFKGILNDYKGKIDLSQFSCYSCVSNKGKLVLA